MTQNTPEKPQKHIVIDARIRRSSTGRYIDRLIEHIQDTTSLYRYTVLTQPDDPWQPTNPAFTVVHSKYKQFSFSPLEQIGFAKQLYSLKADLVHFPMNQQPLLYMKPVVTSTLDLTMLRFTRPGKTPLPIFWVKMLGYRFLFWYSNKKSKAIITISNFVKDDLAKNYRFTRGKTTNTYCASEPPLPGKAVAPGFIAPRVPFLLYVGSAFPHKNLLRLVDAFAELHKSNDRLRLVLVGKKEQYYHKLDTYISRRGLQDCVITPDFLPDEQLKWLYGHARLYVLPSLSEGFGLPGLEAMVHNCPLVSSNATCLPEIYGDAALYFNPNDTEDMVLKIERVLTDKVFAKELVERGKVQVTHYSWHRMAEQTLGVYKQVLGE